MACKITIRQAQVVALDVILDCLGQFTNTAKCASANSFSRYFGEPAFDLIEPRRTGWREMDVIVGPRRQPLLHRGVFMRSVVVEPEMDLQTGIDHLIDPIQEP